MDEFSMAVEPDVKPPRRCPGCERRGNYSRLEDCACRWCGEVWWKHELRRARKRIEEVGTIGNKWLREWAKAVIVIMQTRDRIAELEAEVVDWKNGSWAEAQEADRGRKRVAELEKQAVVLDVERARAEHVCAQETERADAAERKAYTVAAEAPDVYNGPGTCCGKCSYCDRHCTREDDNE